MKLTNSVTISSRNLAHLVSLDTVESYIAVGRAKVKGTSFDPYARVNAQKARTAIRNDAAVILKWYKSVLKHGTRGQVRRASRSLVSIQHGPEDFNVNGLRKWGRS